MLDWWFPWHSVGSDLRYKIWDPEEHCFARADRVDYVCDPEAPMNQKTWGVSHYIIEAGIPLWKKKRQTRQSIISEQN